MDQKNWSNQTYDDCKGQKNTIVSRNLYLDNIKKPKYKFQETILFKKEKLNNKKAICIGLNPAKAEEKIDITNIRLILLLWDKYDEYLLLNIFPEITDNKKQINYIDQENKLFEVKLIEVLNNTTDDIILFFGRTTIIPPNIVSCIKELFVKKRTIKLTAHYGEFTHPGSNADINLIDYSSVFIRTDSVIRVKV